MNAIEALSQLPGLEFTTAPAVLDQASRDASLFQVHPQAVVYPRNTSDIGQLVGLASQRPELALSLTVRGGGTDMSGGPLSSSIVLDMTKRFNKVLAVANGLAVTQPGVYYRDFEAATLKQGWLMPAYPASREICTVGGMVADNAGGEKSLEYGKVERYVEELKIILHDGQEYTVRALNQAELAQKMALPGLEGDIYRRVHRLLEENNDKITAARPTVTKNSAGYNLWNVWDRDRQQFDLNQLLIGSQGTLGIITEITFRLIRPKPHRQLLLISLPNLNQLADIAITVMKYVPESFESYDTHTLALAIRFFPSLFKNIERGKRVSLAAKMLPQLVRLALTPKPALVLLAEFSGENLEDVKGRVAAAQAAIKPFLATTKIVHSAAEIALQWAIRRESFNLLRHKGRNMHTAPFIDDVCVSPDKLTSFFPKLTIIMEKYDIVYTIAGHVGDGNFHIIPLLDLSRPESVDVIKKLSDEVFALVLEHGGSISGEHNDGLIRSHYLPEMFGADIHALFQETKNIFDPAGIFNPGKKIGVRWEEAKKFLRTT